MPQHAFPAQRPESLTSRTDALKKKQSLCHTYLLQKPASRLHWLVPKQPNTSRNRAQHAFPAQRPESLTSRTDALKKNKAYATPTYCKNQLQDSIGWFRNSRTPAGIVPNMPFPAQRPESLTSRTDALKNKSLCHTYLLQKPASRKTPLAGSETAEHQQESCPTCLPSTAPRISNVAY